MTSPLTKALPAEPVDISEKSVDYAETTLKMCAHSQYVAGNDATADVLYKHAALVRALRSALTARERQHAQTLEYIADNYRMNSGVIGPRWWCLREDLKAASVELAEKLVNEWADNEAKIAAKYGAAMEKANG